MERGKVMNLAKIFVCATILCGAGTVLAQDTDPLLRKLQQKVEEIKARDTLPSMEKVGDARCTIEKALTDGLKGASETFKGDLLKAEESLRQAAKMLHGLATEKRFQGGVNAKRLQLISGRVDISKLEIGDNVLEAMAILANDSAEALLEMRNGKVGIENFHRLTLNGADMSQLILLFYSIGT